MKSLSQVMDQSMVLKNEISKLLLASTYKECSDLSALDINYGDSEQLLQLEVLRDVMEKLADIEATLDYMSLPVVDGGQLVKNAVGKYETSSGHVLHAGSMVEALIADGIYNVPYWSSRWQRPPWSWGCGCTPGWSGTWRGTPLSGPS